VPAAEKSFPVEVVGGRRCHGGVGVTISISFVGWCDVINPVLGLMQTPGLVAAVYDRRIEAGAAERDLRSRAQSGRELSSCA
jgi:hypothetical protein